MTRQIKRIDKIFITISFISLIGLFFYFLSGLYPNGEIGTKEYDPFHEYYSNKGIISIFIIRTFLWLTTVFVGITWTIKKKIGTGLIIPFLGAILIVGLLQWIEMWYGSTFYYGEVRDKQGLGFPLASLLLMSYVGSNFFRGKIKMTIGLISILLIHVIIFYLIKDQWRLYFDIFFPGTSIQLI